MNKQELLSYLEPIDRALQEPSTIIIYGSAACMLLDEPDRTSLDVDVAGPYSQADYGDLRQAAAAADILPAPFNRDPLVLENLENLKADMEVWGAE